MLAKCKIVFLFFLITAFNCKEKKEIVKQDGIVKTEKGKEGNGYKNVLPGAYRTEIYLNLIKGKNVALLVNQTSMIGSTHVTDSLINLGVLVKKIFAPEHGFRGEADAGEAVKDGVDQKTGVPIISLYGKRKKPSKEDLAGIDLVIFDIQDVGARFYTYISAMTYVMESCAKNDVDFMVFDRPNPNGHYVDGPVLKDEISFIGLHKVPVVHGMTAGEYAQMVNEEGWLGNDLKSNLTVIKCGNYDHNTFYNLPVRPSPNLPNMRAIYLYPSLCFFEGTTVSEGRGTHKQFQIYGHPKYQGGDYIFTPKSMPGAKYPKLEGKLCYGFDLTKVPIEKIKSERRLNLDYLINFYNTFPKGETFFLENNFFDKLAGSEQLRNLIISGLPASEIRKTWQKGLGNFKKIRKKYLLYKDFE